MRTKVHTGRKRTWNLALHASLTLILQFSIYSAAHAQVDRTVDSLRVVQAQWRTETLDGFTAKRYSFGIGTLFCSAQYLYIIEIPADSPRRLALAFDSVPTPTSALAARHDAHAAVNGSFFDIRGGHPVCYLRIDGRQYGENIPAGDTAVNRKYYQHATLLLRGGRPRLTTPDSNRLWEEHLADSNIMTAGPMLLRGGKAVEQRGDRTFVTQRHNRTALGIRADGTTLLLVADGRHKGKADGLTLEELTLVMRWLGCIDAINLDGGGSSTLYLRDRGGVQNHPSDNGRYDTLGERPVSNAILVL